MGRRSVFGDIENQREKVLELARSGYTDKEISQYLGVAYSSFRLFLKKNSDFSAAIKKAKSKADITVENALFKRAIGFDYVEEVLEYVPGRGDEQTKVKTVRKIKKHIVPDVTAQIFWLKNRRPEKWRDKQNIEHSGEVIEKIKFVPVEGVADDKRS